MPPRPKKARFETSLTKSGSVRAPKSSSKAPIPSQDLEGGQGSDDASCSQCLRDPDPPSARTCSGTVADNSTALNAGTSATRSGTRQTQPSHRGTSPTSPAGPPRLARKRRQHDSTGEPAPLGANANKRVRISYVADSDGEPGPADPGVDDVELEGSQGGDDSEPLTAQDVDEMISAWETSVKNVRSRVLAASVHDERLGKELDTAYVGSAYIRFIGPGDVSGVVDLELNPNKRGNPRGLNSGHVEILHDIFRRPLAKKDHESPIYLAVDGQYISDDHKLAMRNADARNVLSKLPPFVLKRDSPEEEARLEEELWVQRVDGRWLSMPELNDRQSRLNWLRSLPSRSMGYILNGNHRTRAMLAQNQSIIAQRDAIRARLEKSPSNRADLERDMDALQARIEGHTWRCLIYDSTLLTKAAHNYLAHNEHERPSMGMGPGEKAWWLAQKFETEMEELMNTGGTQRCSRAHAANIVQGRWRREIGSKMTMTGRDAESDEPKHIDKVKQLGDLAGADAASRLFFNPLGMELVLDCRPALWAFGELIDKPLAIEMLRPSGGPVIAHMWLSLRTLITLTNVISGEGVTDAESWLSCNQTIVPEGYPEAVNHFRAMHLRPERVPQLLSKYGVDQAAKFGTLYLNAIKPLAGSGRIDYSAGNVLSTIRTIFDKFGGYFIQGKLKPELHDRLLAVSIQLYARLPTYKTGQLGESFYPMATLPSKEVRDALVSRWHGGWKVPGNGDSLVPLEELLERCQMVWTVGAQGSKRSCNWENWYNRSRGLHQVVLRLLECRSLGPTEARLSEALAILEDPRLPMALKSVDEFLTGGGTLQESIVEFCAHKTAKFNYPGVKRLLEHSELDHGSYEDVADSLLKARSAIRASAWEETDQASGKAKKPRRTTPLNLNELLANHTVLSLVHQSFWDLAYPSWFVGWEDAEAKRMGTVGCGVGWGLLHRWFVDQQMPTIFKIKPARWLLNVASRVLELTGRRPWWSGVFDVSDLPRIPGNLPNDLHIFPKSSSRARKSMKVESEDETTEGGQDQTPNEGKARAGKKGKAATRASSHATKAKAREQVPNTRTLRQAPKSSSWIDSSGDEGQGEGPSGSESDDNYLDSKGSAEPDEPGRHEDEGEDTGLTGEEGREQGELDGAEDNNASVEEKTRTGAVEDVDPGVDDFSRPFGDRAQVQANGQGLKPPPTGHWYYHESARNRPPSHIFAPQIASTLLPHNAWRQLAETRDAMVAAKVGKQTLADMHERLLNALKLPAETMRQILDAFVDERVNLRQGLITALYMVQKLKAQSDMVCLLLTDMESGLKDMYMVRCAKALRLYAGVTEEEAITEVSRMASDDGLLDEDLFRIMPDNFVELDLNKTFPRSVRPQIKHSKISVGPLNETKDDRDETMRFMRNILPARGLGRNQQESRERGLLAVEHAIARRELERMAPRAVHGQYVIPQEPVLPPEQVPVKPRLREDPLLYDRKHSWRTVGPSLVRGGGDSPFTDGQFTQGGSKSNDWMRSDDSKAVRTAEHKQRAEYSEVWAKACDREVAEFEKQRLGIYVERAENGSVTLADVPIGWSRSQFVRSAPVTGLQGGIPKGG
ncbi:hypothetical protein FRC10_005040 [Ceratobasidium sp. 414]|nr:hypothetical protein FRC10_005040 [Ceratobasidium sp. 414]